jgi:hypothetical protein
MNEKNDMQKFQRSAQLQTATAQWDTEGGAGPDGPQERSNKLPASRMKIASKSKKATERTFRS